MAAVFTFLSSFKNEHSNIQDYSSDIELRSFRLIVKISKCDNIKYSVADITL